MGQKVTDITNRASRYDYLSQTPGNYLKDNYYLKELQDKVNAEWNYRPNRVDIEYENNWGEQTYSPIEVVVQSVKTVKNEEIADDCRNIVFRDIAESRFRIGSRFRMYQDFKDFGKEKTKNVWLATNTDSVKMTSSMIIKRCTGTLGSMHKDSQGALHSHYEPVIIEPDLIQVELMYNQTAVSTGAALVITAQHNNYTREYFINQRFVVGYDSVYRVKNINKFYSNSTFDDQEVGLIKIYLEVTEKSPYDNFDTRIAYQSTDAVVLDTESKDKKYSIAFPDLAEIPYYLGEQPINFTPILTDENGHPVDGVAVELEYSMENLPETVSPDNYIEVVQDGGTYTFSRIRTYLRGGLNLKWKIDPTVSPTGEEIFLVMQLSLM